MFRCLFLFCLVVCALGCPSKNSPKVHTDIVGGEEANIENYPYQVALLYKGSLACGASIVREDLAITAAHCTFRYSASDLRVRAGSSLKNSGGSIHRVTRIHQHRGYNNATYDNDISILEVAPKFEYRSGVQPIALPSKTMQVAVGSSADISGWGSTWFQGNYPAHLRHAVVKVIAQDVCFNAYKSITDNMICASAPGKDSCQGDSGGPIAQNGMLIGVASFGRGCADPEYPGVYVRITALRDWIKKEVGL